METKATVHRFSTLFSRQLFINIKAAKKAGQPYWLSCFQAVYKVIFSV
jgi:hypothetical protein